MRGKTEKGSSLFEHPLNELLNTENPLLVLAEKIDWKFIEKNLSPLYSKRGRPAHPIRLMAGLLILKSLRNLSDEVLVDERWEENMYYQYFCGLEYHKKRKPCASSDLVHFRKRIGEKGAKVILQASIQIHDKTENNRKGKEEVVYADTTVQEKNITFPTDAKLHKKIIERCNKIAKKEGIKLRNTYQKRSQRLLQNQHNRTRQKRREKALLAAKELKRIAGVILRDLERKLAKNKEKYEKECELFSRVLLQEQKDKGKIYSFHEPEVHCIGKGKANKKYEFGSKFGILWSKERGIILSGADCENGYDGHTLEKIVKVHNEISGIKLTDVYCDRGYRGAKIEALKVHIPKPPLKKESEYAKGKKRKHFRNRAGIEPIIGHLKQDFRMGLNYLKGKLGDILNGLLGCAAFNFKKWMKSFSFCLFLRTFISKKHENLMHLSSLFFLKSLKWIC